MAEFSRVVIVEDDSDLRETLIRYLLATGMEVTGVGSVLEFHETAKVRELDVAVVDLKLPDHSGLVLTDFLRRTTDLAIIILTAWESIENRVKGYGAGADLYLVKPVNLQELAAAIVSLTQRRRERNMPVAAAAPEVWTLERSSWNLLSPRGIRFSLSHQERVLMNALAEAPGESVERSVLCKALGYEGSGANVALSALVRRLRRKIEIGTGRAAPIETSYSQGYSFSALLRFG